MRVSSHPNGGAGSARAPLLREAKATTLGIVLHARSRAMGGEDVVGEVKGVEEVGV